MGASDWADFLKRWEAYGVNRASCVEVGCGPGRLTKHLANTFGLIEATDVSPDMLAYAKSHVAAANVTYHLTDGRTIPLAAESVGAAFSAHVLQHFDSQEEGGTYFREISRVLMRGGSLMVHAPMHDFPFANSSFADVLRRMYSAKRLVGGVRARYRRYRHAQLMRGQSYEMSWLIQALTDAGLRDVEFSMFAVRSNGSYHPFVLARK